MGNFGVDLCRGSSWFVKWAGARVGGVGGVGVSAGVADSFPSLTAPFH